MGTLVQFPLVRRRREVVRLETEPDRVAFWVPLLVLWLASGARVGLAFAHHEVFESEATLAFACLVALPLAGARRWLRKTRVRCGRRQ